jgi:hypothetical protein
MIMACGQLCAWNFEGKACLRPIDEICPMTNIASQGKLMRFTGGDVTPVVQRTVQQKPQTNADRIRAMSDEELAVFFHKRPLCPKPKQCEYDCSRCWLEWLKQPVKENDNSK